MSAGRPDRALGLMDESLSRWTRRKYTVQHATSAYVRAWILLYQGDGMAALESLRVEWPALRRNLYLHMNAIRQWLLYTRAQSALSATGRNERIRVPCCESPRAPPAAWNTTGRRIRSRWRN